jgi:heme-degrading monooxygenase HmoA
MFARVATYEIPAEQVSNAAGSFQQAIDEIQAMKGVTGTYLLISHESGRVMTLTFWEDRVAMEASRVRATLLRAEAARSLEGSVVSADEYEIAAAHEPA